MIYLIAAWLPFAFDAVKEIGGNILQGINNRKARLYNSEQEQVKRRLQAGLPVGGGAITGGGAQVTPVKNDVSSQDHISKSVSTSVQRKQLEIMQQQLREATAKADITEGERDWKLKAPEMNEYTPLGATNQEYLFNSGRDMETFNWVMKKNAQSLDSMNYLYQEGLWREGKMRDKFDAELNTILQNLSNATQTGKLLNLQFQNEEQMTAVKDNIYNAMNSGKFPNFASILYALAFGAANLSNFKY